MTWRDLSRVFTEKFGGIGTVVSTDKLSTRSKFVRTMFDMHVSLRGGRYLEDLLSVEEPIKRRHEATQSSIEAILSMSRPQ